MDSFPFTRSKLMCQPIARRHKLIANWLREIYDRVLDDSLSEKSFPLVVSNYQKVLCWINEEPSKTVFPESRQELIEFISDQFHRHKTKSGKGMAEADFLPRIKTGDKIDLSPWNAKINYKVALDNLRSAFNVGSIFRIVDATGFESVMIGSQTPGKEKRQVEKTAMGCTGWIPQEEHENLAEGLYRHKQSGYRVIGIETVEGSANHYEFTWPEKGIVVLGNEEYGLSQSALKECDTFVHLPMVGRKNSVNVANAFAVIAFHLSHLLDKT